MIATMSTKTASGPELKCEVLEDVGGPVLRVLRFSDFRVLM